jgi:type IV pilus assembly protein PilC
LATSTIQPNVKNINTYIYKTIDIHGHLITGTCHAKTKTAARLQLETKGIKVKIIQKQQKSYFNRNKINDKDILNFTRQLSTMIKCGVPIIESLEICADVSNNIKVTEMINNLKSSVASGHSFSNALSLYPKQFNQFYCNLLKIGENTGKLDEMLLSVANYEEKMQRLKNKFIKAMLYPAMIFLISIIVTSVLLVFVVPQFEDMFNNLNADLPWFTNLILNMSKFLQQHGFILAIILITLTHSLIKYVKSSVKSQILIDRTLLKIPVLNHTIKKICLARFTRTLATMLPAGIPLINCLPTAANLVGNHIFKQAIIDIQAYIKNGQLLNQAMRNTTCFNNLTIQMTTIGENSGSLNEMMLKIAELYEEDIDNTIENLNNIIEPTIILIISIIVGGLIVAMYLPIFSLGSIL